MTYEQYEQEVQRHLTEKRFYHSQCVAQEAARLAQQYGVEMDQRQLAVRSEAFAVRAGGRSARVAKQFIELCKAGVFN